MQHKVLELKKIYIYIYVKIVGHKNLQQNGNLQGVWNSPLKFHR